MFQPAMLQMLRCPEDHSELAVAGSDVISRVNLAIRERRIVNRAGNAVTQLLDGALIRADRSALYPIIDGIPVLISADAILLDQIGV